MDKDTYIAELEEQIHALEEIIALLPGRIYWKDTNSVLQGGNQQNAEQAGLKSAKELVGLTQRDFVSKDLTPEEQEREIKEVESSDKAVMESGEVVILEETQYFPGSNVYYISTKAPLHDKAGNVKGIVGISIDITKQKAAEAREYKALLDAKEEAEARAQAEAELRQAVMVLAGSIAHDMRTPLATIRLLSDMTGKITTPLLHAYEITKTAELSNVPEITSRYLQKMATIPSELHTIVTEMNDYINVSLKALSKVLTKELRPEDLVVCSADTVIRNAIARYPFEGNQASLVQVDTAYQFEFMGNPVLFFRVLSNLIKNALEQIALKQRGEIVISTREGTDMNEIVVKDTAGGASPEVVANLFGGYKTTKQQGTGVGLAFCQLTMESFQGRISCHSVEGEYIEFVLGFPKIVT